MTTTDDNVPADPLKEPLSMRLRAWLHRHWIGLVVFAAALVIGGIISAIWLRSHPATPRITAAGTTVTTDPVHPPLPAPMAGDLSALQSQAAGAPNGAYIKATAVAPEPEAADPGTSPVAVETIDTPTTEPSPPGSGAGDSYPQVVERSQPQYPIEAVRAGDEGEVRLQVALDAAGNIEDVRIARSSGSRTLDRAAMDAVRSWHFRPAMHQGQATAGTIEVPLDFRLDEH